MGSINVPTGQIEFGVEFIYAAGKKRHLEWHPAKNLEESLTLARMQASFISATVPGTRSRIVCRLAERKDNSEEK